jgi:hypothetical protein
MADYNLFSANMPAQVCNDAPGALLDFIGVSNDPPHYRYHNLSVSSQGNIDFNRSRHLSSIEALTNCAQNENIQC